MSTEADEVEIVGDKTFGIVCRKGAALKGFDVHLDATEASTVNDWRDRALAAEAELRRIKGEQ